jgi:hypothetical protein
MLPLTPVVVPTLEKIIEQGSPMVIVPLKIGEETEQTSPEDNDRDNGHSPLKMGCSQDHGEFLDRINRILQDWRAQIIITHNVFSLRAC